MKVINMTAGNHFLTASALYVLKHKDLDVAMVKIDRQSGNIDYVLDVYMPQELPLGCGKDGKGIGQWWASRAIPDSRRGIQQVLHYLGTNSSLSLMLSSYGLSLTDHYWMQPVDEELYWSGLNFYENDFSDALGDLLTDTQKVDVDTNISRFSPSSSVTGEMKKKWVIENGIRYLMKLNAGHYGQQSVNELIACRLHERLGWTGYVPYRLKTAFMDGQEIPCSFSPLFTSTELEFVSAYQLIEAFKVPNDRSVYESLIGQAVEYGMEESVVRKHLEYTILTDFILTNTDRHFNNFGFLYDSEKHRLVAMAPVFDTGNALFYDKEIIPSNNRLLDVAVTSFCQREVLMLRYVTDRTLIDFQKLTGFPDEVEELLTMYTHMPDFRAKAIAQSVEQKIEFLRLFCQGKKIWKKEIYW